MNLGKITRFDRCDGSELVCEVDGPLLDRLASANEMSRASVKRILANGREIATAGYVYRLTQFVNPGD